MTISGLHLGHRVANCVDPADVHWHNRASSQLAGEEVLLVVARTQRDIVVVFHGHGQRLAEEASAAGNENLLLHGDLHPSNKPPASRSVHNERELDGKASLMLSAPRCVALQA
jgi:hypothetical protein